MKILSDLSEVLIAGIQGTDDIIARDYGHEVAAYYMGRAQIVHPAFHALLWDDIDEDTYWRIFLSEGKWPFDIKQLKDAFTENLCRTIPGTLELYQSIRSHPRSFKESDAGIIEAGPPRVIILSDHIKSRIDLLYDLHPDVFEWADYTFFTCNFGHIKSDAGFFENFLKMAHLDPDELIFIDDIASNITSAYKAGIVGLQFKDAATLKQNLAYYDFEFAES